MAKTKEEEFNKSEYKEKVELSKKFLRERLTIEHRNYITTTDNCAFVKKVDRHGNVWIDNMPLADNGRLISSLHEYFKDFNTIRKNIIESEKREHEAWKRDAKK